MSGVAPFRLSRVFLAYERGFQAFRIEEVFAVVMVGEACVSARPCAVGQVSLLLLQETVRRDVDLRLALPQTFLEGEALLVPSDDHEGKQLVYLLLREVGDVLQFVEGLVVAIAFPVAHEVAGVCGREEGQLLELFLRRLVEV